MKHLLWLLLFIPLLAWGSATDVYIAQTAAGLGDGSSCANAYAVTFFNTAGNWGSGASQIGAGTTVHLCGTITTNLTVLGNGAAGNPVTIKWEPGASVSLPYGGNGTDYNGSINADNRSYITFDGGTNGILESTQAGTNLSYSYSSFTFTSAVADGSHIVYTINGQLPTSGPSQYLVGWHINAGGISTTACPNQVSGSPTYDVSNAAITAVDTVANTVTIASTCAASSVGAGRIWLARQNAGEQIKGLLHAIPCTGCTVKNLTLRNAYVHVAPNDYGTGPACAGVSGVGTIFTGNTVHDCQQGFFAQVQASTPPYDTYDIGNNEIYNSNHDVEIEVSSPASYQFIKVHDNKFHDWANWDDNQNANHHDGVGPIADNNHTVKVADCSASAPCAFLQVNSNYFYGDQGTGGHWTSHVFLTERQNCFVFNNVFEVPTTQGGQSAAITCGLAFNFNNTYYTPDQNSNANHVNFGDGSQTLWANNLLIGWQQALHYTNSSSDHASPTTVYSVSTASRTSGVTTITFTTSHSLTVGMQIVVKDITAVGSTSFNGVFTVQSVTSTTLTYNQTGVANDTGTGGTAVRNRTLGFYDNGTVTNLYTGLQGQSAGLPWHIDGIINTGSLTTWQTTLAANSLTSLSGADAGSANGDPIVSPANYIPQAASSVVKIGTNLRTLLTNIWNQYGFSAVDPAWLANPGTMDAFYDKAGVLRSTSGAWTDGAYEIGGVAPYGGSVTCGPADCSFSTNDAAIAGSRSGGVLSCTHGSLVNGTCAVTNTYSAGSSVTVTFTVGAGVSLVSFTPTNSNPQTISNIQASWNATADAEVVPTSTLSCGSKCNINAGDSITLTWTSANATQCGVTDQLGNTVSVTSGTSLNGSGTLTPGSGVSLYVYTLNCSSNTLPAPPQSVTVNVNYPYSGGLLR